MLPVPERKIARPQPAGATVQRAEPMKGDPPASYSYWRLARKTGGAFVIPSRDWP